jgi:hypothetical protein
MSLNRINPNAILEDEPERWLEEHSKNLGALTKGEKHQDTLLRVLRKYYTMKIVLPTLEYSRFSDYLKCEALDKAVRVMNAISSKAKEKVA